MADYVVIMAGGSGTRFWPASRRARPKQFLPIGGTTSLLRQTVERVLPEFDWSRILVVTGQAHAEHARLELPELPVENVLVEPAARNTAACIGWATRVLLARDPDAAACVLPSDHFVSDAALFCRHLKAALRAAREVKTIVLLGLMPTHPETGYGYIERGEAHGESLGFPLNAVKRFVEKPDRATALGYLSAGTYLWNSGMFVFPANVMDAAISKHLPALASGLDRLASEDLGAVYPTLPSTSIDYGVMEKAGNLLVLPANFPWSDVGSWDAAYELHPRDESGNVLLGAALAVGTKNTFVDARSGRTVAIVGLEDVVVVDTPDALLIARRGQSQDVKLVVDALTAAGKKELL